jgi:hypothetical protein
MFQKNYIQYQLHGYQEKFNLNVAQLRFDKFVLKKKEKKEVFILVSTRWLLDNIN